MTQNCRLCSCQNRPITLILSYQSWNDYAEESFSDCSCSCWSLCGLWQHQWSGHCHHWKLFLLTRIGTGSSIFTGKTAITFLKWKILIWEIKHNWVTVKVNKKIIYTINLSIFNQSSSDIQYVQFLGLLFPDIADHLAFPHLLQQRNYILLSTTTMSVPYPSLGHFVYNLHCPYLNAFCLLLWPSIWYTTIVLGLISLLFLLKQCVRWVWFFFNAAG